MSIRVMKGESSDLLECTEPNGKPFYIAVPSGSTDSLRSAADWEAYFANGKWSEPRATLRAAHRPAYQPVPPRDGWGEALARRDNVTAITSSPRFATGHTSCPDGYATALGHRATVHSFPTTNIDGYATALAERKES